MKNRSTARREQMTEDRRTIKEEKNAVTKRNPRRGIRQQIFMPVFLILLIFPLASLGSFLLVSERYFQAEAERSINALYDELALLAEESFMATDAGGGDASQPAGGTDPETAAYGSPETEGGQRSGETQETGETKEAREARFSVQRQLSRDFLIKLRLLVRNEDSGADALAISSKGLLSYPDGDEAASSIQDLYQACLGLLDTDAPETGKLMVLDAGGARYALRFLTTSPLSMLRAKYIICYVKLPESAKLAAEASLPLLLVTLVFLLAATFLLWRVAKRISEPIEELALHALSIEGGCYRKAERPYGLKETEELRRALNTMCERLQSAERNTLEFFQNVSHDLRTPLQSIGGYAQGIATGQLADTKKAAGIILSETERMSSLVDSILTISKINNGALSLHPVELPLWEFLSEQTEILSQSAHEAGKQLIFREEGPELTVSADPNLLIRVIQNAAANCLRYAEREVEIWCEARETEALIFVADDGPGIPEAELPHVFERFYIGENGRFGLGLSIIKSAVLYMGGSVRIDNRPAPLHGAVYRIGFPKK